MLAIVKFALVPYLLDSCIILYDIYFCMHCDPLPSILALAA